MSHTYVPNQAQLTESGEPARPFTFVSRPYGLLLLAVLALLTILSLPLLAYLNAFQSDMSDEALNAAGNLTPDIIMLMLVSIVYLFLCLINIVVFLLWIYKAHQDLGRLIPGYPISPAGAVARVSIPIYSLYGRWLVFTTAAEELVPGLKLWVRGLYGYYLLSILIAILSMGLWDTNMQYQLSTLTGTLVMPIWFVMTLKVHRALSAEARSLALTTAASSAAESESKNSQPYPNAGKRSPVNRWLKIFLILALVAGCAMAALGASVIPGLVESGADWFDDDFFYLAETLSDHFETAETGSGLWLDFTWYKAPGQETEVWLRIELETIETCGAGASDPCIRLADEIAQITLVEYPRINELAGLQVVITPDNGDSSLSFVPVIDKQMSIAEWRRVLNLAGDLEASGLTLTEEG